LVTAFFLITAPSTRAKSIPGNIIAVSFAAVLGFSFRYFGQSFYGCFYAVAIVNTIIPLICKAERRLFYPLGAGNV
jgi:Na+-translocating ferredoxin:NAD+ oxidoreductase RnfD subunit